MGLSLGNYWELNPKQFEKYIKVYKNKEEQRIKETDIMHHILGQYVAFAVNEPNKYPKKPYTSKEQKPSEMTDEEMENFAKNITKRINGQQN